VKRHSLHGLPRRWPARWSGVLALVLVLPTTSCSESANDRARRADSRARTQASTRESETVRRVTTPQDPHRILYHAPDDLSDSNARLTNAPIVGIAKVPQPTEPAVHSGSPPVKPPR
jgi:hypothetical protein